LLSGKIKRTAAVEIEVVDAWSRASVRRGEKEAEKLQRVLASGECSISGERLFF
jgi:hypothetical protein